MAGWAFLVARCGVLHAAWAVPPPTGDQKGTHRLRLDRVEKQTNEKVPIPPRMRGAMQSRLLAYEHATTVNEIASWANNLIGKEVPGDPSYLILSVLQFQLNNNRSAYDALILFEVTHKNPDTQVALKEADIEVIEELTSTIDEPS